MCRFSTLALAAPIALAAGAASAATVAPTVFDFGALAEQSRTNAGGTELVWGESEFADGVTVGDLTVDVSDRAHLDGGFTTKKFTSAPAGLGYCQIDDCNASDFDGVRDAPDSLALTFSRVVDVLWTIRETTDAWRQGFVPDHTLAEGCARVNGVDLDLSGGSFVTGPGASDSFTFEPCANNSPFGISDFYVTAATIEGDTPSPVPLPAGAVLLGTALAGLGFGAARRKG